MIWEIAFFRPALMQRRMRRWSGFNPGGAGFGGRGISQSLSSNERVIDLGEPGTAGNNFVMGETFRRSTPITYIGRFPWELVDC